MADAVQSTKGKMMVSINGRPAIRQAFDVLTMFDPEITSSVGVERAGQAAALELVIMNRVEGRAEQLRVSWDVR